MYAVYRIILTGLMAATLSLAGCTKSADSIQPTGNGATPEETAINTVADLLGVPPQNAKIISIVAKDFRDSSLDCPDPQSSYLMVITPGHQVVVEADGRRFDVRVSGKSAKICYRRKPGKRPGKPPAPPSENSAIS